jgi:hypothetical protein
MEQAQAEQARSEQEKDWQATAQTEDEPEVKATPRALAGSVTSMLGDKRFSEADRAKLIFFDERFRGALTAVKEQRMQSDLLKVQNGVLMNEMSRLHDTQAELLSENTALKQELDRQKASSDPDGRCMSRAHLYPYRGHCDQCKMELVVGPSWYHRPGSDKDLCDAHWQELPSVEKEAFTNIYEPAQLGADRVGYKDLDATLDWCQDRLKDLEARAKFLPEGSEHLRTECERLLNTLQESVCQALNCAGDRKVALKVFERGLGQVDRVRALLQQPGDPFFEDPLDMEPRFW